MEWTEAGVDDQDYQVVKISGDCDLYSAPSFTRAMTKRIEEGVRRLKLDLTDVKYLDSTGVGSLIKILQTAKSSGCAMLFRGISGSPRRVLQMSNILLLMKEEDQTGGKP
jgi:anti-sigma B factor antagonist